MSYDEAQASHFLASAWNDEKFTAPAISHQLLRAANNSQRATSKRQLQRTVINFSQQDLPADRTGEHTLGFAESS